MFPDVDDDFNAVITDQNHKTTIIKETVLLVTNWTCLLLSSAFTIVPTICTVVVPNQTEIELTVPVV